MADFSISLDYCLYEPHYKAIKDFDFLKGFKRSVLIMMVCEDTKHGSWNLSINKRRYSTQFTQPTHYLLNKNDEKKCY